MRKLLHSNFELDLSGFELSDNAENNWFSDSFFTKYSFPFEIDLDKEMDIVTGFISQLNSSSLETYFQVKYVHANIIEDAILEVESYQNKLSCIVRFGFEQLPSFDKKLSELSLEKFDLPEGTTIYQHAQTIITKTWPEVNYNFPQVHTDKFNTEDGLWLGFKKIINNRVNGLFLENSVDLGEDISNNVNIMQPYPYLLYVLQVIMRDSGYTLSGDILTDPRLKKALLFNTITYYKAKEFTEQSIIKEASDYVYYDTPGGQDTRGDYETIITIAPGKYELFGEFNIEAYQFGWEGGYAIWFKGELIFNNGVTTSGRIDVSLIIDNPIGDNVIRITARSVITVPEPVWSLTLNRMFDYDEGIAVPTVINENKIDLPKSTQNIQVQDLIKAVKNWFNYDLDVVGKNAVMNKIQSKLTYSDASNLQDTEVKFPLKKFQTGISFLLKFQDIENDQFKYLPVFQNKNEVLTEKYTVNEKTTTIEINALPLPVFKRDGITTAYAFEDSDTKVYLIIYDGIFGGNNYCRPETDLLIPSVHLEYWIKWFTFRINAIPFTWSFKKWIEDIYNLSAKSKVFAYNKYHIIKTINKTEVEPDLFDVEIETESLE